MIWLIDVPPQVRTKRTLERPGGSGASDSTLRERSSSRTSRRHWIEWKHQSQGYSGAETHNNLLRRRIGSCDSCVSRNLLKPLGPMIHCWFEKASVRSLCIMLWSLILKQCTFIHLVTVLTQGLCCYLAKLAEIKYLFLSYINIDESIQQYDRKCFSFDTSITHHPMCLNPQKIVIYRSAAMGVPKFTAATGF